MDSGVLEDAQVDILTEGEAVNELCLVVDGSVEIITTSTPADPSQDSELHPSVAIPPSLPSAAVVGSFFPLLRCPRVRILIMNACHSAFFCPWNFIFLQLYFTLPLF